jgi:hypothetical protein
MPSVPLGIDPPSTLPPVEILTRPCRVCREPMAEGIKKCESCGADLRNWFARHKIITGFLVFLVMGLLGGTMNQSSAPSTAAEAPLVPELSVTASGLFDEYKADKTRANAAYKDKILRVSGKVRMMLGKSSILFEVSNPILSVQCTLANSASPKAANVKKGDDITVVGKNT